MAAVYFIRLIPGLLFIRILVSKLAPTWRGERKTLRTITRITAMNDDINKIHE